MARLTSNLPLSRQTPTTAICLIKGHLRDTSRMIKNHHLSLLLRSLLEHRRIKTILGSQLAVAAVLINIAHPLATPATAQESETVLVSPPQVFTTAPPSVRYPVDNIAITQGFSFFHPAIDLDGITGDPIYSIMPGIITRIEFSSLGYGNSIIIDHQNHYHSLYAHLSRISVKVGDKINTNTVIGTIGTSGRAFGDHLHLEVRYQDQTINPKTLLPQPK